MTKRNNLLDKFTLDSKVNTGVLLKKTTFFYKWYENGKFRIKGAISN